MSNKINADNDSIAEPTVSTQTSSHDTKNTKNVKSNIFNSLISKCFLTDKVNFKELLSHQEKWFFKALIGLRVHFQKSDSRSFSEKFYYFTNQTIITLKRIWICYSLTINKIYCSVAGYFLPMIGSVHFRLREIKKKKLYLIEWRLNKTLFEEILLSVRKEYNFLRQVLDQVIKMLH